MAEVTKQSRILSTESEFLYAIDAGSASGDVTGRADANQTPRLLPSPPFSAVATRQGTVKPQPPCNRAYNETGHEESTAAWNTPNLGARLNPTFVIAIEKSTVLRQADSLTKDIRTG